MPRSLVKSEPPAAVSESTVEETDGEKFPDSFNDALKLLQNLTDEPVKSAEEHERKKPRITALKAHVFRLQQGLPVVHSSGNDDAGVYFKRRAGLERTKLELLAREHVSVKELLAAHDTLAKENADLKKHKI